MKKLLLLALLVLIIVMISFNGRFNPRDLYSEIPKGSEETAEIAPLLQQTFTYFGEGSQTYAFVSKDGTTVLKLFKARHEKPYTFSRYIRNLGKKDWKQSRKKWKIKFQETCRRYKTAFHHLQDETGLLFLHLQKTSTPLPVTLKKKTKMTLDLADYPFILQKKATLAPEYVRLHPEGMEALKKFFIHRTQKGFSDPRQTLSTNYGFIDGKPIQIDPGKLERFEGDSDAEIAKIHAHIDEWASRL